MDTRTIAVGEERIVALHGDTQYRFPRLNRLNDGRLVLFYRVGLTHMSDSGGIAMRTADPRGETWSRPKLIHVNPDGYSAQNVVECMCRDGGIVLFISRFEFGPHIKHHTYWIRSDDAGETWSEPDIFDGESGRRSYYVTDAIRTYDGLLACSSTFVPPGVEPCYNLMWHSADDGKSWQVRSELTRPEENLGDEVAMLETSPGSILLILRDRARADTFSYRSIDGGCTWGARESVGESLGILQRPLLRRLIDGTILLSGRDYVGKEVVVFLSHDEGRNFGNRTVVASFQKDGAYTGSEQIDDHTVLLVYYTDRIEREKPDLARALLSI